MDAQVKNIKNDYPHSNMIALFELIILISVTLLAMSLSLHQMKIFYFLGQILFALCMWTWFSLLHSLGHNAFFTNTRLNIILGHLASFVCLVPFYSWKYHHNLHHVWTGWEDLDPSSGQKPEKAPEQSVINFLNRCWKLWVPIFTIEHAMTNFWSPKRMKGILNDKTRYYKSVFSMIIIITYIVGFVFIAPIAFMKIYLLALVIFLISSDPLLLSQHTLFHIDRSNGQKVLPKSFSQQQEVTRSITSNWFIDRIVLLNFNLHSVHHQYPNIAHYHLHKINYTPKHQLSLWKWISMVKRMDIKELLWM